MEIRPFFCSYPEPNTKRVSTIIRYTTLLIWWDFQFHTSCSSYKIQIQSIFDKQKFGVISNHYPERKNLQSTMATLTIPPVLSSPRDDAMHLYKAFKGNCKPCFHSSSF